MIIYNIYSVYVNWCNTVSFHHENFMKFSFKLKYFSFVFVSVFMVLFYFNCCFFLFLIHKFQ